MNITERDLSILEILLMCGFLITAQIRRRLFPNDKDGSSTRDRLRKLEAAGYIARKRAEVANPMNSNTTPVWIIKQQGINLLALKRDDPRYLSQYPPCARAWINYTHNYEMGEVQLRLREAIEAQTLVRLHGMYCEHTIINPDAEKPEDRYKLYTVVSDQPRRIVCAPDGAWEMQVAAHRRVVFVEKERGTNTPERAARLKTPGFAGLRDTKKWQLLFPQAHDFRVLAIAPTPGWRDALRKAVIGKPGSELWLFVAWNEFTVPSILHGDIIYTSTEGPRPLVRPPALPEAGTVTGQ